jgi:acyl transferase domain-containing protein/2-polyprenyl-3-methyl-5-hydroxy-6-metoxy-1,4-benzoquinol methylase
MRERTYDKCPIAIVGLSCRLPGAANLDELWQMLIEGRNAFRPFDERWQRTLIHPRTQERKPAVPRAALLDEIDGFDAGFFGISPREAARMDPQQRLLLELAWEAFEAAGIAPKDYAGERVGVFIGFSTLDYWSLTTDSANRTGLDAWTAIGGYASILANRISYAFDFRGPSVALDSACSASLYAAHAAKESLRSGECRLALAGGVNLIIRPEVTLSYARAGMLSPTGASQPFSEKANGFVRGEGAALVLMRCLDEAIAAGDTVHGIIRGSAVSQDGRSNGITVPTVHGQVQLLELAYSDAGIDPARVRYVEAHGTGTPVGDPIELEALGTVLGHARAADEPCLVGSIKSNIGHLEAGAGAAGLVKAALMLRHDQIPPTLSCTPLNPLIPFEELRLKPAQELERLSNSEEPPVIGVNAFGFGGTNVHVVLEGPSPQYTSLYTPTMEAQRPMLFPLTARTEAPLQQFAEQLAEQLRREPRPAVADVAYTLALRRSMLPQRAPIVATTPEQLLQELDLVAKGVSRTSYASEDPQLPVFVLSGMGPQWWGMARRLMSAEPVFRAAIEQTDDQFQKLAGWSILDRVFLASQDEIPSLLDRADIGHPAHFALQVALVDLLASWGIRPSAVVGHSAGEVSAACVSGRLSRQDAVRVLYHRSRLVQRLAYTGNMLAVNLTLRDSERLCERHPGLSVAAINGPSNITLSGPQTILESLAAELTRENRFGRILPGCFPYHSSVFEPIREELVASLDGLQPLDEHLPLVSTVSGTWVEGTDFGAVYWWHNVRDRVLFEQAVRVLWQGGHTTFVELGAHPALLRAIRDTANEGGGSAHCLPTLKREEDDLSSLLSTIGELWATGHAVKLDALTPKAALISLPSYPWQRQPYWIENPSSRTHPTSAHPILGERTAAERPTWQSWVSESTPIWAPDHRVNGQVLLPATSWIESWLSAALEEGAELPLSLKDIRFLEMLPLSSDPTWVRIRRLSSQWTLETAAAADPTRWIMHGSARPGAAPPAPPALDLVGMRGSVAPTPMRYADYEDLGYSYGEAFRLLSDLWLRECDVLARIRPVLDAACDAPYVIHPATLDAAFQASLSCMRRPDGIYLPVAAERVSVYRRHEVSGELWVLAKPREELKSEWVIDITMSDEQGAVVVVVSGLRIARVGPRTLLRKRVLYREAWEAIASAIVPPVLRQVTPSSEILCTLAEEASQEGLQSALDDLATSYAAEALTELRSAETDVAQEYWKLIRHLRSRKATTSAEESLRKLCTGYPEAYLEGRIIETFGRALSRIVKREIDPHELFFSRAGLATAFHSDSETVRPANRALRDAVCREIATRFSCAPVRILEIGAGTGGTTAWLLPCLDRDRIEYVATDLSSGFTRKLEQRFKQYPLLSTKVLDIEQDPELQGFEPHAYDIVVAASALHATAELGVALKWCRKLLRPQGLLLLSEPVHGRYWLDLVFGTLEGWWRFKDHDVRANYPLISSARWESLLGDAGLPRVASRDAVPGGIFAILAARAGAEAGRRGRRAQPPTGDGRVLARPEGQLRSAPDAGQRSCERWEQGLHLGRTALAYSR